MEVDVTKSVAGTIVVIVVAVCTVSAVRGRVTAFPDEEGGAAQAAQRVPIPPDPLTQTPDHKVTPEQMKKWSKELSNWGRWGKDDERGTLNLITPEKTKAALRW
jgi:hypothetical protein